MEPSGKIYEILNEIPPTVKLVCVTKMREADEIRKIFNEGYKIFGENKCQAMALKAGELPSDIEWHFIGHLQSNKVKYIAPFVRLIHSVDSLSLLDEIDKQAMKNDRIIDCLLQFHIATEETKYGLSYEEAHSILTSPRFGQLKNIRVAGVMGMATFTSDTNRIRHEFRTLKYFFDCLKKDFFSESDLFHEISMGMSKDYQIAIEEGSTMIRIGTKIFNLKE